MQIDSHQHFWKYNPADYVWMSEEMSILRHDFLPETLEPQLRAVGFDGTIAVQARQMLVETEWLLELADQHPFIKGVVGWVDFESPQLGEQLERFASHPKLRGVRELIHDMADIDYAISVNHLAAISQLANFDLTYDLLLKPPHIRPAITLVEKFPNQPFVVDHLAKPAIAAIASTSGPTSSRTTQWERDLRDLATHDNVCCKLSGMVTEAVWNAWQVDDFRPYLDIALEAFGPERLMIGSDWPVCTLAATYEDVMGIVVDYVNKLAENERNAILGGTCARFYDLDGPGDASVTDDLAGAK
ncbi:Amidohydrolase [Novipirellula aureliae]|uniref:Amidohydrolase n=1 Tax=Novipirellula aureliae TaxID=2527966 RepID=A0A5C6DWC1_9BACT|nr:amidohydrolase family protein [Novipirellula aureliae]TWU39129.1 Amidohydrolase [Novipirellula aureliae]